MICLRSGKNLSEGRIVKKNINLRLIAARIIDEVLDGHSLSELDSKLTMVNDERDRAFVQAICYGVCRYFSRLDIILSKLLSKPLKAKDSAVYALLLVGLYQLMDMRVPPHAAVAETVNATVALKKNWAKGLVNAILREYLRRKDNIMEEINADLESEYAHPLWWIEAVRAAWPHEWQAILQTNNQLPPLALRVNEQKISRTKYLSKLTAQHISAEIIAKTPQGIILTTPQAVEELPGFSQGEVTVQDGAAQLAAQLLTLKPQQLVLDACAAPGGKLTHLLEIEPLIECVAIEKETKRLASIKENLARLKLTAKCINEDANEVSKWWDGRLFDRILLDAPCSASGVVRRHPDIKLLRKASDIPKLQAVQKKLLQSLWPLLKPGGLMVYATCSVFPAENNDILREWSAAQTDCVEVKIDADWGMACDIGRQILPGMDGMDGFYYAKFTKK